MFKLFSLLLCLSLLLQLNSNAQDADNDNILNAKPFFINGEAKRIPAFTEPSEWIKEELWVETTFDSDNDGQLDRMHVWVTRPNQTENGKLKLPIVYHSSPYFGLRLMDILKKTPQKYFWDVEQVLGQNPKPRKHLDLKRREKRPFESRTEDKQWVPRGYVMVYSASPGTELSDGVPTIGGENESLAPKAVIDWLNGRANGYRTRRGNKKVRAFWSSGKVGMIGTSYDGTLALAAATTGVEGLAAIIPIAPVSSWYQYYRSNGLVRSPGAYLGEDVDVLYDMIHTADKDKRANNNKRVRDAILMKKQDRTTGDYNNFWAGRDYLKKANNIKAAMLISHGFNDWNVMPEQSFRIYNAAKEQGLSYQLYYHQNGHGGPPPFKLLNRWFTKYLHGIDNQIEEDPKVWILREDQESILPYQDFPDPKASGVPLFLQAGNPAQGTLSTAETTSQKNETLLDDYSISGKELALDAQSNNRLLYVTPTLKKDIRISGEVKVTINLSSNRPAANLSVWLVSLPWNKEKGAMMYENIITRGWADPKNYKSISNEEPLEKNKFYDVSFKLMPDDQIIKAGQEIGLMIFSSDKEFTLHPPKGTELTIDLNKTSIMLPVVGGVDVFEEAVK